MGNVSSTLGYDVGFDSYYDLYKNDEIIRKRKQSSTDREQLVHEERNKIALPRAEDITERLEPLYKNSPDELFTFCWSIDTHMPLDPPEEHRVFTDSTYNGNVDGSFGSIPDELTDDDISHLIDLYDSEIHYVDAQIGKVLDMLKQEKVYDDTMVVIMGDHGEAFREHETIFHGNFPYDEVLHVPLILKPPNNDVGPETVSNTVSIVDILPTILDLLGVDDSPNCIQGQALPPFEKTSDHKPVYSETQLREFKPAYRTGRTDRWKYVDIDRPALIDVLRGLYNHRGSLPGPRFTLATIRDGVCNEIFNTDDKFLYDLSTDPDENYNLATERPDLIGQFQTQLSEWINDCIEIRNEVVDSTDSKTDIDAATEEQLKQLGYFE
jgi:arylsulfatase A-like enzyme